MSAIAKPPYDRKRGVVKSKIKHLFGIFCVSLLLTTGMLPLAAVVEISAVYAQSATPAAVRQGYNLLNKGWVNDAINAFIRALKSNPQSIEAKLGLATAYQRAGKDADAWNAYLQVLAQSPNNQAALKAVGTLGGYRPEWQARGVEALTKLLQITPNDTVVRAQRALLLGYQGRFAESIAQYQNLLSNNPAPETLLGAAQVYTYSGDYRRGLELFNRYRGTGKQISKYTLPAYALALQETGNVTQAIQVLKSQLSQLKGDDTAVVGIRAALAQAYQANNQLSEALTTLQPLRGNKSATLTLARALSQIGRSSKRNDIYTEAIGLYSQVLATQSSNLALVREVADVMSEAPQTRSQALKLYQQLLAQQPNNRSLLVKQLTLESQLGQLSREQLRQRLSAVLQPLPTDRAEQIAIAQVLLDLEPPEPALLDVYQQLIAAQVDAPFLNYRVAQIYLQQNQLAQARQALTAYTATAAGAQDVASDLLFADIERASGNLDASADRYTAIIARQDVSDSLINNALRALVGIRLTQNRADEAIAIYDQIIARNPEDLVSQLGRTNVAYQAKRITTAEAEAVLNKWLQVKGSAETPPELFNLVAALPASTQREQLYNTLLNIEPNNLPLQLRLVQVIAQRDPKAAKEEVAQIIARDPDNISAYFLQGELGQSLNDLELAAKAYEAILARQAENTDATLALAGVRFQQRQFSAADKLYRIVLSRRPKDQVALSSLAELSAAQDHPLEAIRRFKQLRAAQTPVNPVLSQRIERIQVDWLKRRSFQPYWERY